MGKVVKYCNSCEEGFAAKFTFCPDCGKTLEACEMNPIEQANAAPQEAAAVPVAAPPADLLEIPNENVQQTALSTDAESVEEPIIEVSPPAEAAVDPMIEVAAPAKKLAVLKPVAEATEKVKAAEPTPNVLLQTKPLDVDRKPHSLEDEHSAYVLDGNFYVTVIEEKNVKQRNTLLLGSLCLVFFSLMSGLVYNIFSKDLEIGAISDDIFLASLIDDVPMTVEEEQAQKKDKEAGGGGGGGREEEETTQGDLANQTKNPERAPQAIPRMTNPELLLPPASTQGNKTFEQKYDRYGDPNGRFSNWNNGPGTGGGQGTGTGTGQGSGRGTGAGSGIGSGYGSGVGDGNGSGTGDGLDGSPPPPKPGPSQGVKIVAKPRANYTDPARQNQVQGTVSLRVVFQANGQIGGISSISGLPYGLTEQAIAAARQIRFEPAMKNGVPYTVSKTVQYSFTIY